MDALEVSSDQFRRLCTDPDGPIFPQDVFEAVQERQQPPRSPTIHIRQSEIPGAGRGLFAAKEYDEGEQIFENYSQLCCVEENLESWVCDWCFAREPCYVGCYRCKVYSYCSQKCRHSAWDAYHQYECPLLRVHGSPIHEAARILFRVLVLHKAGLLSRETITLLNSLSRHPEVFEKGKDPEGARSTCAFAAVSTDTPLSTVYKAYSAISVNMVRMTRAKCSPKSVFSSGYALDGAASFINHSCDPNAFISSNGRNLRVTELQVIKPGEEITCAYVDPSLSLLTRQLDTVLGWFFECICWRCRADIEDLEERARTRGWIIGKYNDAIFDLCDHAGIVGPNYFLRTQYADEQPIKKHLDHVARKVFTDGKWPKGLFPLPHIYGAISVHQHDILEALGSALKGALTLSYRGGEYWIWFLNRIVDLLSTIYHLVALDNSFTANGLFNEEDFKLMFFGYLHVLDDTLSTYFGDTNEFADHIWDWQEEELQAAQPPVPDAQDFERLFLISQRKFLRWLDLDDKDGLELV